MLKVLLVGLPMFSEKLSKQLSAYDGSGWYRSLNTYYSFLDKVRAYFLIPRVSCIFSINGTLTTSRVFDRAIRYKVPVIMHWAGTDVVKSRKAFLSGNYRKDYLEYAIHQCSSEWMRDDLKEIGIDAPIVHFNNYDKKYPFVAYKGKRLTILSYVPDHRPEFYGMSVILQMAKLFPEVDFVIAGTKGENYSPLPSNVQARGWVSDMEEVFEKCHVCLRYTKHDGLSNFILESLARHRTVIYRNPLNGCIYVRDENDLEREIKDLTERFGRGDDMRNDAGADFIESELNSKKVLSNLIDKFKSVSGAHD